MDKEESLVCHLPHNPETTKSEDSKGYQANETLQVSTTELTKLEKLDVPIRSNTECIQIDQSYQHHKPHQSIQSYGSKSKASIVVRKLDVGNSVPGTVRQ
jgi:uncharacterized protein YggE